MQDILKELRKKKGVTQEELASVLAISKGAVSKWETGTSLPDITLLPAIANFYDCQIDDLFTTKELSKEWIKQSYVDWGNAFHKEGFVKTFQKVQEQSLNYLNEPSLLLSNVLVVINHLQLENLPEIKISASKWCLAYLNIVKEKSTKAQELSQAEMLQALAHLALGEAEQVIADFGEETPLMFGTQPLLAQALIMTGDTFAAQKVLQKSGFQLVLGLHNTMEQLTIYETDLERFTVLRRIVSGVVDLFDLVNINPGILVQSHLNLASAALKFGDNDMVLVELTAYVKLLQTLPYPFEITGNQLFNQIGDWVQDMNQLHPVPVNDQVLANQLVDLIKSETFSDALSAEPRYQEIVAQLEEWREKYDNR